MSVGYAARASHVKCKVSRCHRRMQEKTLEPRRRRRCETFRAAKFIVDRKLENDGRALYVRRVASTFKSFLILMYIRTMMIPTFAAHTHMNMMAKTCKHRHGHRRTRVFRVRGNEN